MHLGLPETLIAGAFAPSGGTVPAIPQEQQDKRLYTSDVPAGVTADDFKKFFNDLIAEKKPVEEAGDAVVEAGIDPGKKFAFLEVRLDYNSVTFTGRILTCSSAQPKKLQRRLP